MIRSRILLIIVLVAVVHAPIAAYAQGVGGTKKEADVGPRRGVGDAGAGLRLLRVAEVQKDLELTDTQKVQILTLSMESRNDPSEVKKRLESILNPTQLKRLKQIRMQVEGPAALLSAEVSSALELSPEQIRQLKALQDGVRGMIEQIMSEAKKLTPEERRAKLPELFAKMQQARNETTEKSLDILTPSQREKFAKLHGPKIDLSGGTRSPVKNKEDGGK